MQKVKAPIKAVKSEKEEPFMRLRSSPLFKLKDKRGKNYVALNIKAFFGFVPEVVIIEKPIGENNKVFIRAILTKEEEEKEDRILKQMIEEEKKKGGKNGQQTGKPVTKEIHDKHFVIR